MSSRGWPECTRSVRSGVRDEDTTFDDEAEAFFDALLPLDGASGGGDGPMWRYVGFVSVTKDVNAAAPPNIARGRGCCGRIVPDGSVKPARRCIGTLRAMSSRQAANASVGCGEKLALSCPYFLWSGI